MREVSSTPHLIRRSGTWYYQRRVPVQLVALAKTPIVKFSLKTQDRKEALRLVRVQDLKTDMWFDELAAGTACSAEGQSNLAAPRRVSVDDLIGYARQFVTEEDRLRAKALIVSPPRDENERDNMIDEVVNETLAAKAGEDFGPNLALDRVARAIKRKAGGSEIGQENSAALLSIAGKALLEVASRQGARLDGDNRSWHFDAMFAPRADGDRPRMRLGELAEQYLDELREDHRANNVAAKTTKKREANVAYLLEAVGRDTVVTEIDYTTAQKLRQTLNVTPANRSKKYKGASLEKAIEKAEQDNADRMEHLTQLAYISEFKKLMSFAVRTRLIQSNPAEDLKPLKRDTVPRHMKRQPLSPEQLIAFFTGNFYKSCAPDAPNTYRRSDRAWRFWLPLMMLFSGARPNELCQLYVEDIKKTEAGTWYFDLVNEAEDQSRKTDASKRCVPIHAELIRLGFLDFVEHRRKGAARKGPRLFYELSAKSEDEPTNFAHGPGRAFNRTFLPAEIDLIPRRQVLYSIRHSVRDALRRSRALEEALYAIGGWTPAAGRPVSSDYGNINNPDLWKQDVDAISYPGLDLSFLYGHTIGLDEVRIPLRRRPRVERVTLVAPKRGRTR